MFEKKRCSKCGEKIKDEWDFCPRCGRKVKVDRQEFPGFKISPMMKSGGISIIIQSGTGMEPRVNMKTSGGFKRIEPEIKRKIGVQTGMGGITEEKRKVKDRIVKSTEEPETEIKNAGNRKIIFIKLPNVRSEDDIEINRFEQSIEIRAFAGDKAYFKLIPVPANALVSDEFDKGMLKLEIES